MYGRCVKHKVGIVAGRKSCYRYTVQHRTASCSAYHQCILIVDFLQTEEDLQGISIFYWRITEFLSCTWLPDVIWWRPELVNCFQNQLYPLAPEIPSVLLSCITTVSPDPQVLYRNAWASDFFFSLCPVEVVVLPVLQVFSLGLAKH